MIKLRIIQFMFMLFVILAIIPSTLAGINGYHACADSVCMEGTEINFTIYIYNNLQDNIVVDSIYIKEKETGQVLSLDARDEVIIVPDETKRFLLPSVVQAPIKGYSFYYVPCFYAKSFDESGLKAAGEVCGSSINSFSVVPLSKVECRTDSECSESEYCNTFSLFKCKTLECAENEQVVNHKCEELSCAKFQYIKDHECMYNSAAISGFVVIIFIVGVVLAIFTGRKPKAKPKVKTKKKPIPKKATKKKKK